jgi:hypothetical protein
MGVYEKYTKITFSFVEMFSLGALSEMGMRLECLLNQFTNAPD